MAGNPYYPSRPNQPPFSSPRTYEAYPEKANLYQFVFSHPPTELYVLEEEHLGKLRERVLFTSAPGAIAVVPESADIRRALRSSLLVHLRNAGYRVKDSFLQVINTTVNYASEWPFLRIHPAFNLRVLLFGGDYWLCVDHQLVLQSRVTLAGIETYNKSLHMNPAQRVIFRQNEKFSAGRLISLDSDSCSIALPDGSTTISMKRDVAPELTRSQIASLAPSFGISAQDIESVVKRNSFLTISNAPRARLDACTEFVQQILQGLFPIVEGELTIGLVSTPASLRPPHFVVEKNFTEPMVAFDHADQSKRARDIVSGLTKFGVYDKSAAPLRLLLVSISSRHVMLERLVERLNRGAARYPGAQKTFGSGMIIREHLICQNVEEYEEQLQSFVRSSTRNEIDIALIYLPKVGNADSVDHPYFRIKGLLVHEGLASQMVDEATVVKPDWRDLNLALNIYTKAGCVPWVLDDAIPDVDLFIGLSSSQIKRNGRVIRMMGYVNVFDAYGRWQFYQGDSVAFAFEERLRHYSELIRNSVSSYRGQNDEPLRSVHVHLTKRFSAEERRVIAQAVRSVEPKASVIFVWVNPHHMLRLYDLSEHSDGRIGRATYLSQTLSRGYLSTTGSNLFDQKSMGTPVPLELSVWADPIDAMPNFQTICQQILSLTRLNWASSRNFCQEPITTKFAGDIARLMSAFMENPSFSINPSLRGAPWFL